MTAPPNGQYQIFRINNHKGGDTVSWPAPTPLPKPQRTRMGGLWVAAVAFAVVLLLLLIFVLQNGQRAEVSFLGAHGRLPMGVALLLAAVFGILLVAVPGTARIVQLRILQRSSSRRATTDPLPGTGATDATPPLRHRQDG